MKDITEPGGICRRFHGSCHQISHGFYHASNTFKLVSTNDLTTKCCRIICIEVKMWNFLVKEALIIMEKNYENIKKGNFVQKRKKSFRKVQRVL